MDGGGQSDTQRHMMDQQQGGWYGGPPNPYRQHQMHQPQQHPSQEFKWQSGYESSMEYPQPPVQPYSQPDYHVHQQQQQYLPPPPPPVPHQPQAHQQQSQQYLYAPQHQQVWPRNNGWSQPQWNHQNATSTGSEEEDWAAKARAWAAAKAAQDAAHQAQQVQTQPHAEAQSQGQSQATVLQQEQGYQDYQQQAPQAVKRPSETGHQKLPLVAPGPNPGQQQGFGHDSGSSFGQEGQMYLQEAPGMGFGQGNVPLSFGHDGVSSSSAAAGYGQPAHAQVVPDSYPQDVSSNYGQDSAIAAPPGMELQENSSRNPSHTSLGVMSQPHPPPQLPAPHVSPHSQTQQLAMHQEPVPPPPAFEYHQFEYQQQNAPPLPPPPPPLQDYEQQPPNPYLPPPGPAMGLDSTEMGFGAPSNAMSVWPPMGGPAMGFPPGMGPGGPGGHSGPQFDHHSLPHPHPHPHPMHGYQPSHIFPRQHGPPPHGPGFRPPGPPVGGPFGFGGGPPIGQGPGAVGPVFLPDGNGNLGGPERPRKASVPSWLREELLKKKSTGSMTTSAVVSMSMSEDFMRTNGSEATTAYKLDLADKTRSDSSDMSDNDEEDEDDKEAARIAAMNQEIKRVLTEVLLKVTDDLIDEIAQEVMDEDEVAQEGSRSTAVEAAKDEVMGSASTPSAPAPAPPVLQHPSRVLVAPLGATRAPSEDDDDSDSSGGAPTGNVLGLATYASDEEDQRDRGIDTEQSVEEQNRKEVEDDKTIIDRRADGSSKYSMDAEAIPLDIDRSILPAVEKEKQDKREVGSVGDGGRKEKEGDRETRGGEGQGGEQLDGDLKEQSLQSKGRKRSNEGSSNSSDHDTSRSPRRARHAEHGELGSVDRADVSGTIVKLDNVEQSGKQVTDGLHSRRHSSSDLKGEIKSVAGMTAVDAAQRRALNTLSGLVAGSGEHPLSSSSSPTPGGVADAKGVVVDPKHEKGTKGSSNVVPSDTTKAENTHDPIKKRRESEGGHKVLESNSKSTSRLGEKSYDEKGVKIREKDRALREKERMKDSDRSHEKDKSRYERGEDRERLRGERGREHGRVLEQDRRKTGRDHISRDRERRKEGRSNRRNRRRSSSSSSRSRSGSHDSSSEEHHRSPNPRRQPVRRSRRASFSRSPVRSRRRY